MTSTETKKRKIFSTEKIVVMAVFASLAFAVSYLEFPIFPATPWFKLDVGNTFIMLVGFLYGPVEGIIVCLCKEALCVLFKSHTAGIGELANIITMVAYIILPSIMYKKSRSINTVAIGLSLACIVQTVVALPVNRFLTYPLYMGENAVAMFNSTWIYLILFNLIKAICVTTITLLLYKQLSKTLARFRKDD